jgi:hypothetical protein
MQLSQRCVQSLSDDFVGCRAVDDRLWPPPGSSDTGTDEDDGSCKYNDHPRGSDLLDGKGRVLGSTRERRCLLLGFNGLASRHSEDDHGGHGHDKEQTEHPNPSRPCLPSARIFGLGRRKQKQDETHEQRQPDDESHHVQEVQGECESWGALGSGKLPCTECGECEQKEHRPGDE